MALLSIFDGYIWGFAHCLLSPPHSAHQAIMRTNLLREELEELKISMNASEEQKTMIVAQNKQLVSHPSTLKWNYINSLYN